MPTSPKNNEARCVRVALAERSYTIYLTSNGIEDAMSSTVDALAPVKHFVMLYDAAVEAHAKRCSKLLTIDGVRIDSLAITSGESSKCVDQLAAIWNWMLEKRTDRSSVVVAVGGGVIGDLAGFAAASYARGLRFLQLPTTLLAMVDSSVGGKTGINLPAAKNMVGAFWQPTAVVIETSFLDSLPSREYLSGLAEIVKYGVILDPELFQYLEEHVPQILARDPISLEHIIRRSCELKAHVVSRDERETTGLRAILNYGHTFGHAIEAATSYGTWLHGEAIAIGMTMAAKLAVQLGRISPKDLERQTKLLRAFQLPIEARDADPEKLWALMQHDKKVEQGTLRFILPTRIGHVELCSGITKQSAIAAM